MALRRYIGYHVYMYNLANIMTYLKGQKSMLKSLSQTHGGSRIVMQSSSFVLFASMVLGGMSQGTHPSPAARM